MIREYSLATFIAGVIFTSMLMVAISMNIYYESDAYRLDLSHPEYASRRSEIVRAADQKSTEFSAEGPIDNKTIDEFMGLYDAEAKRIVKTQPFANDVLKDKELGVGDNQ